MNTGSMCWQNSNEKSAENPFAMLRSLRSLAKTPLNKSNKFDWKPYRLEVYGPPPERIDAVIKDASRVAHTYIPPRTDNEVAERPLDVFPGERAGSRKSFFFLSFVFAL